MPYQKISVAKARKFSKHGVNFVSYMTTPAVNIVTEETKTGHFEEFRLKTITFIYLVIDGSGVFVLDDEKVPVIAGDMLVIEPGTRIHYFGKLKITLISVPAWRAEDEEHVRFIKKTESPFL